MQHEFKIGSVKTIIIAATLAFAATMPTTASADISAPINVATVQVYIPSTAFVETVGNAVCSTSVFKIDLTTAAGPGMLSVAMTALSTGKKIVVESIYTGCTGWGTGLQSLKLMGY